MNPAERLAEILARAQAWGSVDQTAAQDYAADVPWLLERIAHLEDLVRRFEWCDDPWHWYCHYCEASGRFQGTGATPRKHALDCPAFTPDGELK